MSTKRLPMEFSSTGEDISKRKTENFQFSSNVMNIDNSANRGKEIR